MVTVYICRCAPTVHSKYFMLLIPISHIYYTVRGRTQERPKTLKFKLPSVNRHVIFIENVKKNNL